MQLQYLSNLDCYIGKFDFYSNKEIVESDRLETIWRNSLPRLSFYDLLKIFPEAKPIIRRCLLQEIKQCKADLDKALQIQREYNKKIISKVSEKNIWFYEMIRDLIYVAPFKEGREEKIKKNYFLLSALNSPSKINLNKITDQEVAQAKTVLIENFYLGHLYMHGNTMTGKCPFHNEKNGSFTIYTKTNRWYCFGCQTGTDVIDFVMKQRQVNFLEAVKIILNK